MALIELAEGLASAHRNDKTSVTAVSDRNTFDQRRAQTSCESAATRDCCSLLQ